MVLLKKNDTMSLYSVFRRLEMPYKCSKKRDWNSVKSGCDDQLQARVADFSTSSGAIWLVRAVLPLGLSFVSVYFLSSLHTSTVPHFMYCPLVCCRHTICPSRSWCPYHVGVHEASRTVCY